MTIIVNSYFAHNRLNYQVQAQIIKLNQQKQKLKICLLKLIQYHTFPTMTPSCFSFSYILLLFLQLFSSLYYLLLCSLQLYQHLHLHLHYLIFSFSSFSSRQPQFHPHLLFLNVFSSFSFQTLRCLWISSFLLLGSFCFLLFTFYIFIRKFRHGILRSARVILNF